MPGRWVRLWDDLLDSGTWRGTDRQLRVAIVLLLRANWQETTINIRGRDVSIAPGELIDSAETLAVLARCSVKAVRRAVRALKVRRFIVTSQVAGVGIGLRKITILNWPRFQGSVDEGGHRVGYEVVHRSGQDPRSKERKKKIYRNTSRALPGLIYPVGRRPDPNGGVPVSSFQYRCSNCRETMLIEDIAKHETLCRECRAPFGEEAAS